MEKKLLQLIKKNKWIFWDTKLEFVSEFSAVEKFLNYGEIEDIAKLIKLLGYEKTKDIFKKQINQERINYTVLNVNYFIKFFELENEVPYKSIIEKAKRTSFFYREV